MLGVNCSLSYRTGYSSVTLGLIWGLFHYPLIRTNSVRVADEGGMGQMGVSSANPGITSTSLVRRSPWPRSPLPRTYLLHAATGRSLPLWMPTEEGCDGAALSVGRCDGGREGGRDTGMT